MSNRGEAQLVVRLLQAATAAGLPGDQIGVISPYRAQVALLGRLAKEAGGLDEVEVLTVDKCQGRDKDCILLSLVRSNPEAEAGEWDRAVSMPCRCRP
jgi:DNA replication ATP-dependent helicase Dna2